MWLVGRRGIGGVLGLVGSEKGSKRLSSLAWVWEPWKLERAEG